MTGAIDSIAADVPEIVSPAGQQFFLATLKLAELAFEAHFGVAGAAASAEAAEETPAP